MGNNSNKSNLLNLKITRLLNYFFLITLLLVSTVTANDHEIQKLKINFSQKSYFNLRIEHENALKNNYLQHKKNKHKIKLSLNNQKYFGSINLNGLGKEHFNFKDFFKASFSLQIKKNNLSITNKYKLQDPKVAYYDTPFLFNLLLDHFDLPLRKVALIKVENNLSKKKYIKTIEESFGKKFINENFLGDGLIFKMKIYNKRGYKALIANRKQFVTEEEYMDVYYQNINELNLSKYESESENKKEALQKKYAFDLFGQYLNKKIKAEEVFDIETAAKIFFINSLWGEMHSVSPHNIRFYFNPINKKIFLIPTDPAYPEMLKTDLDEKIYLPFKISNSEEFGLLNYYNIDIEKNWSKNLIDNDVFKSYYFKMLLNIDKLNLESLIHKIDKYKNKFDKNSTRKIKNPIRSNISQIIRLMNKEKNRVLIKQNLNLVKKNIE